MKTIGQNFVDWEATAFGFGYGTGEEHILPALRKFFVHTGLDPEHPNSYDYRELEKELGATVTWLLINRLCQLDVLEYGTSPRFGWLTETWKALRTFLVNKLYATHL